MEGFVVITVLRDDIKEWRDLLSSLLFEITLRNGEVSLSSVSCEMTLRNGGFLCHRCHVR